MGLVKQKDSTKPVARAVPNRAVIAAQPYMLDKQ
jgi:hypothetical protein